MPVTPITVHYLELTREEFSPKPSARDGLRFARVDPQIPALNRFFYAAVGAKYFWLDRRPWTFGQWRANLDRGDEVETWVLSVDGVPAGYVELERCGAQRVEIKYFGLLDAFVGQGLGGHLLTEAVERAFAMGGETVLLDTCSLDHPNALTNYQARGFREVRTEVKHKEIPDLPPGPWENA